MLTRKNLQGVWTALITPFKQNGALDLPAFDKLLARQITAGVTGVLINGTTGESPTLTTEEVKLLVKRAKQKTKGKCLLMVGSGTNCTAKSISASKNAVRDGADVLLVVNPYYNKPTQEGLYLHFKSIADSVKTPIILYNIKGRTSVNLETTTLLRLIKNSKNIIGVKEASGDLKQIAEVCQKRPANFTVLSGDDGITFQVMRDNQADGVISVASNIAPKQVVNLVTQALNKNWSTAEKINNTLAELMKKIFIETNPIPVKYAIYKMGLCQNSYRLPMCPITKKSSLVINQELKKLTKTNNLS